MRVIYFSKSYTPHDHRFLSSLSGTEHEIFYLKLEAPGRQTEDRPVPGEVRQIPWAGGQRPFRWRDVPRLASDLRRLAGEIKPDLIHAGPIQNCAFIAALSGFRPLVTMSWGYDLLLEAEKNAWMQWVTRYTLKRSAFFVSDALVTRLRAISLGMDSARTAVFPWGVDLRHFTPKKLSPEGAHTFTIFCNRTWEPIYGIEVLARAFVNVAAQRPDVDLILLGGGSQGAQIRQILMQGGVLDRVHFGGHVSQADLPRWYGMADLYISPSHVDGSSVSLMEALASGLPCLVSDIAGNREWIEQGVNGWLFRDGDVQDLTRKILDTLRQRDSFVRIGEAARQTAEQKADWAMNFGKLLAVYDRVLSTPSAGRTANGR